MGQRGARIEMACLSRITLHYINSEMNKSMLSLKILNSVLPPLQHGRPEKARGVTISRATNGGWRKDRSTSGQRGNKFNTSYRDISVIVAENNSVVKPKYQQYTSLNKMLSNFSKVLMAHISFTAVINNRGIGKGIGGIRKGTLNLGYHWGRTGNQICS